AAVRTAWGVPNEFPASRFLDDVPEDLVDWRRRESSMQALRGSGSGWGGGASAWGRSGGGSGWSGSGGAGRSGPVTTRKGAAASRPGTGRPVGAPRDAGTPSFGSGKRQVGDVPSLAVGDKVTHDSYGLG